MNQDFEKSDLETVDYYFVFCIECQKATEDHGDWPDAIMDAKQQGFTIEDGAVYCSECTEKELERRAEDAAA